MTSMNDTNYAIKEFSFDFFRKKKKFCIANTPKAEMEIKNFEQRPNENNNQSTP